MNSKKRYDDLSYISFNATLLVSIFLCIFDYKNKALVFGIAAIP